MKKSSLTIILVILIVLLVICGGLLALIILGESTMKKFERGELTADSLHIDCPTCNNNPTDIQECIIFLQENRNHPQIAAANAYGFDLNDIKSVEKRIMLKNFQDITVRCIYHN